MPVESRNKQQRKKTMPTLWHIIEKYQERKSVMFTALRRQGRFLCKHRRKLANTLLFDSNTFEYPNRTENQTICYRIAKVLTQFVNLLISD